MDLSLHIFFTLLSLLLLWKGSEWLVESAARIAKHLGISQLIIGLTVVALGTSAPEFAVTIGAAINGQSNISVSNVIGSNIFNLGFILGGVAVIKAIESSPRLIKRDGTILVVSTILLFLFLFNLHLSRIEGIIFALGLILYNLYLFHQREPIDIKLKHTPAKKLDVMILIVGILLVIAGGYLLREGSVFIARSIGISNWVIGATVVAAGTSAPEFATSLMASLRGHHSISAGNLIGSCIYNTLGVLGLAAIIRPLNVMHNARSSTLMLSGLIILSLIFLATGKKIARKEGLILLAIGIVIWIIEFL